MKYAFPLDWPTGWPRTQHRQARSPFKVSGEKARAELESSVKLISGSKNHVISSNVRVSSLGRPYAEELERSNKDAGVAIFWTRKGESQAVACDLYATTRDNMRALSLAIDGLRAMERSGIHSIVDRAFAGFARLPAAAGTPAPRPWWQVLGWQKDPIVPGALPPVILIGAEEMYRSLAKTAHPDVPGGSTDRMTELNAAVAEARRLLRGKP